MIRRHLTDAQTDRGLRAVTRRRRARHRQSADHVERHLHDCADVPLAARSARAALLADARRRAAVAEADAAFPPTGSRASTRASCSASSS